MLVLLNSDGYTPLDLAIIQGKKDKAALLIQHMRFIKSQSAIRFICKPHKLDLKFEKAFTLSIEKNHNSDFFRKFP